MSHHLAERIESLRSLPSEERADAEAGMADLVLRIWERRQGARFVDEPLALTDSVTRALARLDPTLRGPFLFYRPFDDMPGPSEAEIEANAAMKIALQIDDTAGDLVSSLIKYAAEIAVEKDARWVAASQAGGSPTLRDLTTLLGYATDEDDVDSVNAERHRISKHAKALEGWLQALKSLDK